MFVAAKKRKQDIRKAREENAYKFETKITPSLILYLINTARAENPGKSLISNFITLGMEYSNSWSTVKCLYPKNRLQEMSLQLQRPMTPGIFVTGIWMDDGSLIQTRRRDRENTTPLVCTNLSPLSLLTTIGHSHGVTRGTGLIISKSITPALAIYPLHSILLFIDDLRIGRVRQEREFVAEGTREGKNWMIKWNIRLQRRPLNVKHVHS